jgi:NAD+ synthase (glutamine-hydrolysing)
MNLQLKIALAQLNFHVANFELNKQKMINSIQEAKELKSDLIVFPELSVCAYPPRDFLEFDSFIKSCIDAVHVIASHAHDIAIIVGAPAYNQSERGKKLFNAAYFLEDGEIKSVYHKGLLPTYDVFDEFRYFEPASTFQTIQFKGHTIALTICEDLWDEEIEDLDNNGKLRKTYSITPMDVLMEQNPDCIINIAASPFSYIQAENRQKVLHRNALKYQLPIYYVNHVGAQTELIFDGGSMVVNSHGTVVKRAGFFKEELLMVDQLDLQEQANKHIDDELERIYQALVLGIKDFFSKMNFKKAVLGLSGGIDSALVCTLAAKALGKENVHAVLLPSKYSSDHSVADAEALAKNLGISYETIAIQSTVDAAELTLKSSFANLPAGLAEENLQARVRALLLMGISNKHGYILLNTSNKSEAAVGYGTLYGDMCGGLSVIADLYKTQVYALCNYINREYEIIPSNTIIKAPSAELRPNQKDSDSLPEYDVLDKILRLYIEERKGFHEICEKGFDDTLVKRVIKLVNANEFKRHQTPPILRLSPKAFGMGRRMPIVAKYD